MGYGMGILDSRMPVTALMLSQRRRNFDYIGAGLSVRSTSLSAKNIAAVTKVTMKKSDESVQIRSLVESVQIL
jgi:hypothetical protein